MIQALFAPYTRFFWLMVSQPSLRLTLSILGILALVNVGVWAVFARRRRHYRPPFSSLLSMPWYVWHLGRIQLIVVLLFMTTLAGVILLPAPSIVTPQVPLFEAIRVSEDSPLVVEFDRPVPRAITGTLTPHVEGTWDITDSGFGPFFTNALRFTPSKSLTADTEYVVEVKRHAHPVWDMLAGRVEHLFLFQTPPLATVLDINPAIDAESVAVDEPIELTFSPRSIEQVIWNIELVPDVATTVTYNADNSKAWVTPLPEFQYATDYTVSVFRTPVTYDFGQKTPAQSFGKTLVTEASFTTAASGDVSSITPSGRYVLPSESLEVSFSESMERESVENALSITPEISGTYSWVDDATLVFRPTSGWKTNFTYALSIDAAAATIYGTTLEEPITHEFTTVGAVEVIETDPLEQAGDVSRDTVIQLRFNQPVEEDEVESRFSISPRVSGAFSWQEDTMTFAPEEPLSYDTVYTVALERGIPSSYSHGVSSVWEYAFTTESNEFMLDIPQHHQNYGFTCFSAAASMALAYYGVSGIDELGFMESIGYEDTPRNFVTNTWGDPNKGVVGSHDGSGSGGYGAHWGPVSDAIAAYRPTEVKRNWNISELLSTVRDGTPVLVWWVNGVWPARDVSWFTSSGEKVYTVNGMHVEVVKGFIGDEENPDYIVTNDPWRGERRYTPAQFASLWRWFDETAVIVR